MLVFMEGKRTNKLPHKSYAQLILVPKEKPYGY